MSESRVRTTGECCGATHSEPLPKNHVVALINGVQPRPSTKGVEDKFPVTPDPKCKPSGNPY